MKLDQDQLRTRLSEIYDYYLVEEDRPSVEIKETLADKIGIAYSTIHHFLGSQKKKPRYKSLLLIKRFLEKYDKGEVKI